MAIATGKLTSDLLSFIRADEKVGKALVAFLETLTTTRPITLDQPTEGYVQIRIGYDASVAIYRDGRITIRSPRLTNYTVEQWTQKLVAFAEKLGFTQTVNASVKNIARRFGRDAVLSDTTAPNGARVVRVRI